MKLDVTRAQTRQDGGLVQVRQVSHVLVHVKLGRVHLLDLVLLEVLVLQDQKSNIKRVLSAHTR